MSRGGTLVCQRRFWILLSVLMLVYIAWGTLHLGGFQWDDDEGINVIKAQLVSAGFRLYDDIWSDQPPLLTWILSRTFQLVGPQVSAGRFVVLLFASVGLIATAAIARYASGPAAALLATLLLALTPDIFTYSRAIMVGLPAMSLAVLSLYVVWRRHTPWRLLAAGALFGAGMLIKPITAYEVVVLAAIVALPTFTANSVSWRALAPRWGWLALGGSIAILPVGFVIGPKLITQVVGTYVTTKTAYPFSLVSNLSWLGGYLIRNVGLFALAGWGVVSWVRTRRSDLAVATLWLLLTSIALVTHSPLRSHQFLLLLFPAAILGAKGIEQIGGAIRGGHWIYRGLAGATVLVACGWTVACLSADAKLLVATDNDDDNWAAVDAIRAAVAPGDLVVSDAPMLAFRADRRVPPTLAVPSLRRLRTGGLTEEMAIQETAANTPSVVAFWDGRFDLMPDYAKWVAQHYELARSFDNERKRIYMSVRDIPYTQEVDFGGEIKLLGYRLGALQVHPSGELDVALYWQAIRQPTGTYNGFVHLLGPQGGVLSQHDLLAGTWSHVTAAWQPGEIVVEHYHLAVPPEAPSGPWPLEVGLYDYYSGQRLAVAGADGRLTEATSVLLSFQPVIRWAAQMTPPPTEFISDAQFGQLAQLMGYDLHPLLAEPGDRVELVLYWHALGTTADSYTVFVHVLDADGALITQDDAQPGGGRHPTYGWVAGEYLTDDHSFALPPDAAPGTYTIGVGFYDPKSGERLPASDGQGHPLPGDLVPLVGLEVLQ